MSSKLQKIDPRVKRTRQLLRDALFALVKEKELDAITVQDITAHATLNRATFYLHYRDKYDLFTESIEEMLGELMAQVEQLSVDVSHLTVDDVPPPLVQWFEQIATYADLYRVMLGKQSTSDLAVQMRTNIEQFIMRDFKTLKRSPQINPVPISIHSRFLAAALLGVIEWWLEQKQPYSAEKMVAWLWRLMLLGLKSD
jgi:AcrR family transcriptional regulator